MSKIDIVNKLFAAIEKNQFNVAKGLVTDDFTFTGPVPKSMGSDQWLDLHKKMNKAMPDFKFNLSNLRESGNVVNGSVRITGTQSQELPSLMPGMDPIAATNKKIQMPEENFAVKFKGDKVSHFTVEKVPNGGVPGFLKQLGVTVPGIIM